MCLAVNFFLVFNQHSWYLTFHAMMSTVKDRNGKDLTETKEIFKRCDKNTR